MRGGDEVRTFHAMGRVHVAGVLTLATLVLAGPAHAAEPDRNVVLIVADDLGLDLGCYGHTTVKSPHLDALAKQGTRFTQAFCTTSSCSASRSVILTGLQNHANGQYGHQHGEHNFHTLASVRGLPNLLEDAGYRTARIGKFHVQPESSYAFGRVIEAKVPGGDRNGVQMAELCRDFLAEPSERPFFLYFCPTDPHRAARGFANDRAYPGVEDVTYDPAQVSIPAFLPDQPEVRRELVGYLQAVSRFDQGVGRLLKVIDETGHADDTLVIFVSDNGAPFPGAKTSLYEPGMRLPLLVREPGATHAGGTCDALVTWADLVPTILDFARARGPAYPLHGRSFLGVLGQEHPEGWDEAFASHTFHEITMYYPMRAVRTRKFKLIWNIAYPLSVPFASDLWGSDTWQGVLERGDTTYGKRSLDAFLHHPAYELYDLESDPDELRNLAADPAHRATLEAMQARLERFQKSTRDPWIVKRTHE